MNTIKMVSTNKFEVELIKDEDGMYVLHHGHVLGPLDKSTEPISDLRMANILFNLKIEEYEKRLN